VLDRGAAGRRHAGRAVGAARLTPHVDAVAPGGRGMVGCAPMDADPRQDRPIRVAIVEDQPRTREGLAALIGADPAFRVTHAFPAMEPALEVLERDPPDVLLADIALPGMSGIDGVRALRARRPDVQILMLTVHGDSEVVFEAICAGASGYLLKDTPPARLLAALRELHAGGAPMSPEVARKVVTMFQEIAPPRSDEHRLSPRELDVLRRLTEGHSYKTAAAALGLSIDTLRFHVRNVYRKLHVHSKSEAVLAALRRGIVR
jgi:DNA-binding NarL/FixJ family response regulator